MNKKNIIKAVTGLLFVVGLLIALPGSASAQTYDQFGNPIYNYGIYGNYYPYYGYDYGSAYLPLYAGGTVLGATVANPTLVVDLQQQLANLMAQVNALTATPTVGTVLGATSANTPTCSLTRDLSLGDVGTDVRTLQRLLGVAETGMFDNATYAAVVSFQEQHRLEILVAAGYYSPTGIVGPYTRSKLNKMCNGLYTSGAVLGASTFATPVTAYVPQTINPTVNPIYSNQLYPNVNIPGVTLEFYAIPPAVRSGDEVTLIWNTRGVNSCQASGSWSGTLPASGSRRLQNLTHDSSYTLRCFTTSGQQISRNLTVPVGNSSLTAYVDMTANPNPVTRGGRATITWNSRNASSCTASGGTGFWPGVKSLSGSFVTDPLFTDTDFSMTCQQFDGSSSTEHLTVDVIGTGTGTGTGIPTLSFYADPNSVQSGSSSILNWSTTNASSCVASGGWNGQKATSGSMSVGPLNTTTTYTLRCTNSVGDSVTSSVTIGVFSN